jgi:hypothetical protein
VPGSTAIAQPPPRSTISSTIALVLQYVQQNPTVTTNTVEFQSPRLDDTQLKNLAHLLIKTYPFVGKSIVVYTTKGPSNTRPLEANQVAGIRKYLKAFIDVDRSPLEDCFNNYDAADVQRTFIIVQKPARKMF